MYPPLAMGSLAVKAIRVSLPSYTLDELYSSVTGEGGRERGVSPNTVSSAEH